MDPDGAARHQWPSVSSALGSRVDLQRASRKNTVNCIALQGISPQAGRDVTHHRGLSLIGGLRLHSDAFSRA